MLCFSKSTTAILYDKYLLPLHWVRGGEDLGISESFSLFCLSKLCAPYTAVVIPWSMRGSQDF